MNRILHAGLLALAITFTTASAAQGVVLTTGTLTDAGGAPAGGQVRVYAWVFPKIGKTAEMPLLGTATAGPDGQFSVAALDENQVKRLAGNRRGYVDFAVVGNTGAYQGSWGFTGYVDAPGGAARVSMATDAIQARSVSASFSALRELRAPEIAIRATRRTLFARSSMYAGCDTRQHVRAIASARKMTVIGELNNAYNDGTRATFDYSREGTAETTIGAASKFSDGSWGISAEYTVTDKGQVRFPPFERRLSRKLRSLFEYTQYEVQSSSCAVWEPFIRVTAWIGDTDTSGRQDGLDKCDSAQLVGYRSGARWGRQHGDAVRYTRAVEVFGVSLTARSGFSNNVALRYLWGGSGDKRHYICGPDGKESPFTSGRVFTGSRK